MAQQARTPGVETGPLQGERVVGEERLLTELHERIRDVRVGPDGAVHVLTDNDQGRVLKLVPKGALGQHSLSTAEH